MGMDNDARNRIRRAMLAKKATSPKVRGQYKRAVRAARLEQEARQQAEFGPRPRASAGRPHRRPSCRPRSGKARPLGDRPGRTAGPAASSRSAPMPSMSSSTPSGPRIRFRRRHCSAGRKGRRRDRHAAADEYTRIRWARSRPCRPCTRSRNATPLPTDVPPINFDRKDPFTMLLLGVDTREGDTDPSRSDTIILAYVDPLEKHVNLLSIPRDLLVTQAGGFGQAKMSDVYANGEINKYVDPTRGGIALVRDTIEQNFRIQIDYYAQVDFNGFKKIVDAFGGVTVDNPYPIKDDEYPTEDYQFTRVFFPAGIQHLYGEQALAIRPHAARRQRLPAQRPAAAGPPRHPSAGAATEPAPEGDGSDRHARRFRAHGLPARNSSGSASRSSARTCRATRSSSSRSPISYRTRSSMAATTRPSIGTKRSPAPASSPPRRTGTASPRRRTPA